MSTRERSAGRVRMFYFYLLWALQKKQLSWVIREWFKDYLVPIALRELQQQGIKDLDIVPDPESGGWTRLSDMFNEAEGVRQIIKWNEEHKMFAFETDRARLLKVVNEGDKYFEKEERSMLEKAADHVATMHQSRLPLEHALYQVEHPKARTSAKKSASKRLEHSAPQ